MLFLKECKKIIFSVTFVLYTAAVLAMYFTQFDNDREAIPVPREGTDSYGTIAKEVPEILMPAAIDSLISEYLSGGFAAYPIGFYRNVKLSDRKKDAICEIINELSGLTRQELDSFEGYTEGGYEAFPDADFGYKMVYIEPVVPEADIPADLTYERFRELMKKADGIIGGGSKYSDDYIIGNFSRVPKTYEDALAEYNSIVYEQKITPAYARLFCDYSGIDLSILPVFVAAALAAKDKKSQMEQLVYSRKISSARLVLTRYAALIAVMSIPVIFTVIHAQIGVSSLYEGYDTDKLAFAKYSAGWLLPNLLLSASVGMLLTELLSPLIAVFVQGAWWFGAIFASSGALTGQITSLVLVPRHNSLYGADVFASTLRQFTFNRIFYAVLSLVLIAATAAVYEIKRGGGLNGHIKNNKNKSAA